LSNANDALEKLRITALTDREVMSSGEANVTIEVKIDEGSAGKTGKIIVRGQLFNLTEQRRRANDQIPVSE
jgi:heat shock protein beta